MKNKDFYKIKFNYHEDSRGKLVALEPFQPIPFIFKRIYYLSDITFGAVRGAHAHKNLKQCLVALSGSFQVHLKTLNKSATVILNNPYEGLIINELVWRDIRKFSHGAVCLCIASELYDPNDYIYSLDKFYEIAKKND